MAHFKTPTPFAEAPTTGFYPLMPVTPLLPFRTHSPQIPQPNRDLAP